MESLHVVRYVTTRDGYSIAYTVQGSGTTLICLPLPFSHCQRVLQESSATPLLRALANRFRVIYYDGRGQGLSRRGLPAETSSDSFLLDLRAVVDALAPSQVVVLGIAYFSHVAIRFAVERPESVASLALMHCATSYADGLAGVIAMARANWDYFLSTQAGLAVPNTAEEIRRLSARVEGLKERTTQDDMLQVLRVFEASDVSLLLPRLSIPTLVMHPSQQHWIDDRASSRVAALVPNGRLVTLRSADFFGGDEAAAAIEALCNETEAAAISRDPARKHVLSVREVEVLKLVAEGKTNQEIAAALVISLNTVTRHLSHVYAKAGVANRAQAVLFARDHGLA